MPSPHNELPIMAGEPRDSGCAGCPGCGSTQSNDSPRGGPPEDAATGIGTTVLAPIGLFLLPVVTAMLGALWGTVAAFGQFLGGLAGLAFGMSVAVLAARIANRRKQARDAHEPAKVVSHSK